jgi:hypothetical protein
MDNKKEVDKIVDAIIDIHKIPVFPYKRAGLSKPVPPSEPEPKDKDE